MIMNFNQSINENQFIKQSMIAYKNEWYLVVYPNWKKEQIKQCINRF